MWLEQVPYTRKDSNSSREQDAEPLAQGVKDGYAMPDQKVNHCRDRGHKHSGEERARSLDRTGEIVRQPEGEHFQPRQDVGIDESPDRGEGWDEHGCEQAASEPQRLG
jgi:hypothetical protein